MRQAHCGQASGGFLLYDSFDAVAPRAQTVNERFGFGVVGDRDCQVGIAREPRLGTRGNSQTTDEGECEAGISEVGADLTKDRFERRHPNLTCTSIGRPWQSPNSAPGR